MATAKLKKIGGQQRVQVRAHLEGPEEAKGRQDSDIAVEGSMEYHL